MVRRNLEPVEFVVSKRADSLDYGILSPPKLLAWDVRKLVTALPLAQNRGD
jgi:hypothetical protein